MATVESLEALLAESLQCLDDAAGELRQLSELDLDRNLRRLGKSIIEVWAFREEIHKLRPDLKPSFVTEYEADRTRYDRLQDLSREADRFELNGDLARASEAFQSLRVIAKRGYFAMVAEAGLFRIAEMLDKSA